MKIIDTNEVVTTIYEVSKGMTETVEAVATKLGITIRGFIPLNSEIAEDIASFTNKRNMGIITIDADDVDELCDGWLYIECTIKQLLEFETELYDVFMEKNFEEDAE